MHEICSSRIPGSNCDRDMYNAAIKSGAQAQIMLIIVRRHWMVTWRINSLVVFHLETIYVVQVQWQCSTIINEAKTLGKTQSSRCM